MEVSHVNLFLIISLSCFLGGSGGAGGGAPAPGQSGPNGIYGPPDGYISAGEILDITLVLGSVIGAVTGGLLLFA
jgi:hypothetical protein